VASGGISGVAVALATAGGVLLYAGFQGLDPVQALRDITTGKTKPLEPTPSSFTNDPTTIGQGITQIGYGTSAGGEGFPQLVAAAMAHRSERYSQTKRWAKGFSDCSSFVGKRLKEVGVTPPSGSTTLSYLTWGKLRTVPRSAILPGDILVASGHMAIAISPTEGIGQQNGRRNVQVDSITNLMWGEPGWIPRRYIGAAASGGSSGGSSGAGAGVAEA